MTRILAHGPERFLHPGEPSLLVSLEGWNSAHAKFKSIAKMAEEIALGGADALIVTPQQARELSDLLARLPLIAVVTQSSEIAQAAEAGLDGVLVHSGGRAGGSGTHVSTLITASRAHKDLALLLDGAPRDIDADALVVVPADLHYTHNRPAIARLDAVRLPRDLFEEVAALLSRGVRGVLLGRAVLDYDSPQSMTRALSHILRGGDVDKALAVLTDDESDDGGNPACLTAELG